MYVFGCAIAYIFIDRPKKRDFGDCLVFPIADKIIKKQGYAFAKRKDSVIRAAVRWADVIHFEEPFSLEMYIGKIVKQEKKPLTAAYHLHPENIFATIHLRKNLFFNSITLLAWRNLVFNQCVIVQCPTESAKRRLEKWHCKAELRVISNGMLPVNAERAEPPVQKEEGVFLLVSTGRYSEEKDQITLLKDMNYSRYAQKIQLVLAGKGPTEKKLRRIADRLFRDGVLQHRPIFGFYTLPEMQAIYRQRDLYIHCAIIEVSL